MIIDLETAEQTLYQMVKYPLKLEYSNLYFSLDTYGMKIDILPNCYSPMNEITTNNEKLYIFGYFFLTLCLLTLN